MRNKIIILIGTFLLLIPFRLPISVLLINIFNYLAHIGVDNIPLDVLKGNVMVSKGIYAFVLAILFQLNVHTAYCLRWTGKPQQEVLPLIHMVLGFSWIAYIIYDVISTGLIFDMINK